MWIPFKKVSAKASNQKGIGGRGENDAAGYLRDSGYEVVDFNWYNSGAKRLGEIDIIAKKDKEIVFIEVKSRAISKREKGLGNVILPEEQITRKKIEKINRVAQKYITQKGLWDAVWRIDAITVLYKAGSEKPKINHLKNIFY